MNKLECFNNQKHTRIYQTEKDGTFCEDCMYVNVKLERIPDLLTVLFYQPSYGDIIKNKF